MLDGYLKRGADTATTLTMGWYIDRGNCNTDPPKPDDNSISDIYGRDGEIDPDLNLGLPQTYPMRTLTYVLFRPARSNADAQAAYTALVKWARSVRGSELYDHDGLCTYQRVTFSGAKRLDNDSAFQRVRLTFKAWPWRKDGEL